MQFKKCSRFLGSTNGTKTYKASHIIMFIMSQTQKATLFKHTNWIQNAASLIDLMIFVFYYQVVKCYLGIFDECNLSWLNAQKLNYI